MALGGVNWHTDLDTSCSCENLGSYSGKAEALLSYRDSGRSYFTVVSLD